MHITIPGTPATVSRKIARFKTFRSVSGPHLKRVNVSKDHRATFTAAYAILSDRLEGSMWVFCTALTSFSDHTGCDIGLSQKLGIDLCVFSTPRGWTFVESLKWILNRTSYKLWHSTYKNLATTRHSTYMSCLIFSGFTGSFFSTAEGCDILRKSTHALERGPTLLQKLINAVRSISLKLWNDVRLYNCEF